MALQAVPDKDAPDPGAPTDRRARRRLETIDEVVSVAVEVMAEHGVAGLSLGEVARRMGIKTPSLYVYFDSKHALYDAVFERGAQLFLAAVDAVGNEGTDLVELLTEAGRAAARWAVEHPTYSQLLFWRPVPGFTPSPRAYAPAVEIAARSTTRLAELQRRGLIRADVAPEDVFRDWTVLTAGVISQQLSNGPEESFDDGAFTSRLPVLAAMFAAHYGAAPTPPRRGRNVRQR
jgi:AcrR family transcriptional regulator